jgi:hypothetical protein
MRKTLIGAAALATLLSLGTSAQAFQADWITDARIAETLEAAKAVHGANPQIAGFAMEELVVEIAGKALGRQCRLSADRQDMLRDVICLGHGAGRPIQIQVKSGTSAWTTGRICEALEGGRYKGARMVLADDTYANVMAKCGALASSFEQSGMLERAGISTARVRSVAERLPRLLAGFEVTPALRFGTRLVKAIPYMGAAVATGMIAWEAYEAGSDPSLDTGEAIDQAAATVGKETFTLAAGVAATLSVAGGATIAIPSAPVVVPIVAGAAAGAGIGYAISETGLGDMVSEQTVNATHWTIGASKAAWDWASRRF